VLFFVFLLTNNSDFLTDMDVDGSPRTNTDGGGRGDAPSISGGGEQNTPPDPRPEIKKLDLGPVMEQCSNARTSGTTLSVTDIANGECTFTSRPVFKIGSLDWHGDTDTLKTFFGGRVNKNGRTVNECISLSFDPRNLFCIGCATPHHIWRGG
jgi:hypothetical protein